jgi:hypothetical protein
MVFTETITLRYLFINECAGRRTGRGHKVRTRQAQRLSQLYPRLADSGHIRNVQPTGLFRFGELFAQGVEDLRRQIRAGDFAGIAEANALQIEMIVW